MRVFARRAAGLHARSSAPSNVLRDITAGNNDVEGLLNGQYPAGPGWDACTGWGAPDGKKLLAAFQGNPTS